MVHNTKMVSDKILTNTSFYYVRLSEFPSKLATLEYSIKINFTNIEIYCAKAEACKVTLDIYTTENDQNLKMNCSRNAYGQLRNENLFTPMTHQFKQYRFTTCNLDDMDSDLLHCTGRTTIQDYLPRHYGFSFGYVCRRSLKPSLVGLSYNFTISQQSNETKCSATPSVIFNCRQFYDLMSLPNMIGNPDRSSVKDWVYDLKTIYAMVSTFLSQLPTGNCYQYLTEILCRFVFPQCNATMNQVIHTCREMCFEAMDACLSHAEI